MDKKTMTQKNPSRRIPRLRFPEFQEAGEWESDLVKNLITTIIPPKKLSSKFYKEKGLYPVIDQSQNYICGWTDDESAVVFNEAPLIIFGDHTCTLKIVDQAFAQGSDGIKIIKSKNSIDPIFMYHCLLFNPVIIDGYKRHFSKLREKIILFPKEKKEQKKIADCLSSIDERITLEAQELEQLKAHKKGLMQQLFPAEGETTPRLRFPEFQEAKEWDIIPLGKVAENLNSKRIPVTESARAKGDVPYYGATGIIDHVKDYIFHEDLLCISEDGANLIARNYPIAFSISGKSWVNNHAHVLRFSSASTQVIVENYLNSINLENFLTGTAQPKLNKAKLDIIPIPLPNLKEQQKIADCLSSIDELINIQTQQLTALKQYKKGLMQQLFPTP